MPARVGSMATQLPGADRERAGKTIGERGLPSAPYSGLMTQLRVPSQSDQPVGRSAVTRHPSGCLLSAHQCYTIQRNISTQKKNGGER